MRACYCGGGMHARKRARVSFYLCGARRETERVRARIGKNGRLIRRAGGQRTMLGSDETLQRRTAANCRRTLLFSMRPLNGHTITASMRTRARSATAAQKGAKCQLGSAASIDVIFAVAGRESTAGSNRSGSKMSLAAMDAATERQEGFRRCQQSARAHSAGTLSSMFLLACAGALVLPLRHPAAAVARGCCQMTAKSTEQAKAALLSALAELKRAPSPGAKRAVLSATSQLEASDDALSASADGRWALLFSTQGAPEVGQPAGTIPLVQPLIDATYATFFRIAPALAGAQQDGAAERFNEQRVSLTAGVVENRVRVPLPSGLQAIGAALEIRVDGLVAPIDAGVGEEQLRVEFTECAFRLLPKGGGGARGLVVPLPRPVGSLRTTFCDATLRVSRGGRGGVFVLKRLPGVPGRNAPDKSASDK